MNTNLKIGLALLAGILLGAAAMQGIRAQAQTSPVQGVKNTELVMHELGGVAGKDFIVTLAEIPVGGIAVLHTHPGDAYHYLLEGEWQAELQGKAMTIKTGEGMFITRDQIHGGKFPKGGKLLSFYVLDKGFPRVVPAK